MKWCLKCFIFTSPHTCSLVNLDILMATHKHSFDPLYDKIINVLPTNQATQPSIIQLRKEINRVILILRPLKNLKIVAEDPVLGM